jgi:hypothetical protein
MATQGPYGYTGGLNTIAGPYDIQQGQYASLVDAERTYGHITLRNGWSTQTNAHPAGGGVVYPYYTPGFGYIVGVAAVASTKVATIVTGLGAFTWTDITGGVTLATTGPYGFAVLNSILMITDGTNTPVQWSGAGNCTQPAGPPSGLPIVSANNYMFIANTAGHPSRVFYSAAGDPTTWPAASYFDFRLGDSDSVTALVAMGENLVIFKNFSMGFLYTTFNTSTSALGPLVTVSDKYGCSGINNVDRLPDGRIVFMGADHQAYVYDGTTVNPLSNSPYPGSNVQPTFTASIAETFVHVYKKRNQIWFGYLSATWSIAVYDYTLNTWVGLYGCPTSTPLLSMGSVVGGSLGPEVLIGSFGSGKLSIMDTGNSFASPAYTPVPSMSVYIILGADGRSFVPRSVFFPINVTGSMTITMSWQYNSSGTTFTKTFSPSVAGDYRIVCPITFQQLASYVKVTFTDGTGTVPWSLYPYYISDEVMT